MPVPAPAPPSDLLLAQALRLEQMGAHHHAEPLFAQRLARDEARCGAGHRDTAAALNDLARCRFNGGRLLAALRDYRRLLELLDPDDHDLANVVRHQIERCLQSHRQRLASERLHAPIAALVRDACSQRAVVHDARQRRRRGLARQLIQRGHLLLGARLMQAWLNEVLRADEPIDSDALHDLRDHALALWNGGLAAQAEPVLRGIVQARQRWHPDDADVSVAALRDWGRCLAVLGQRRSSRETLALAEAWRARRPAAPRLAARGAGSGSTTPWLHRLLRSVLWRCSGLFDLDWPAGPPTPELDGDRFRTKGCMRLGDASQPMLTLELCAPAAADPAFPHLDATLYLPAQPRLPGDPSTLHEAIGRLSDLAPGVTVVHRPGSDSVALRGRVVFSGCDTDGDPPAALHHALEEVALNMVVGLLSAAHDWLDA